MAVWGRRVRVSTGYRVDTGHRDGYGAGCLLQFTQLAKIADVRFPKNGLNAKFPPWLKDSSLFRFPEVCTCASPMLVDLYPGFSLCAGWK